MATIYIETHGCQMNEADSQYIVRRATGAGYALAERAEDASVLVLNTCTVRDGAEKRAYGRLHHWKAIKNADPSVLRDLERWMSNLAPEDSSAYEHDAEGPDDMPAHLRSSVTRTSETLPIADGRLGLGTWQAVYLWEHRKVPHVRQVVLTIVGV